ncbi:MAG: hypothetical protein ACO3G3_02885 [Candidatus Nanopelagicaceae bacterium]
MKQGVARLKKVCKVCRAALPDGASPHLHYFFRFGLFPSHPPLITVPNAHGELKKRRHVTLTDTAFNHLGDIAHEARKSNSETLERLIRSTPVWEGSATLADNAWEQCFDHTQESVDPSALFPDESF